MMRSWLLALSYARRDLRGGLKGLYIFLACIILSVATISCVYSVSASMKTSLFYDGRYILGGDIALQTIYDPVPKEQLDFLQKHMGPVTVVMETRAMARTFSEEQSTLVELKAVDPFYPLYGQMEIVDADGKVIDTPLQDLLVTPRMHLDQWGTVVEPDLMSRLNLKIGDQIRIGKQEFEIRGIINKEPDRIGSRHFAFAPRAMISSYTFNETGLKTYGSQVYYDHKIFMPQIKSRNDLEKAQNRIEEAFPKARWKGRNFLNAAPNVERSIDRLTLFFSFIGFATLLIGGIGITNAVRSFLDNKLRDIATLKCLGAKEKFVFRVYMLEVLILATLGIIVGLGVGIGVAKAASQLLTAKLSLNDHGGIYPFAIITSATFGYLMTFCASLWPIGRAVKTAPTNLFRDLISPSRNKPSRITILWMVISAELMAFIALITASDTERMFQFLSGLAFAFVTFYFCSVLVRSVIKRIHIPNVPELRMAITNLYRPGNTSTSTILSIGLGLTVLIAVALIQHNFSELVKEDLAADAPSFFFLDIEPNQVERFTSLVQTTPSAHALNVVPSLRGRIVTVNGVNAKDALVDHSESWVINSDRGFTYLAKQPKHGEIIEGEWWPEDYDGKPIVSIADDVQDAFNIGVGDKLTVKVLGKNITAEVANVRDISWRSFNINFAVTFAPGSLNKIPANHIATLIVDEEDEEKLQNLLAKELPNITSVRVGEALEVGKTMMRAVTQAISISAAVTLLAGIMVLSGGVAASRKKHLYDAIILKVLGATRRRILKTFLLEYSLLAMITVITSAILGTAAAYGIQEHMMRIPWKFDASTLIITTVLCLAITLTAGFIGTWRALNEKPAPYLRNE